VEKCVSSRVNDGGSWRCDAAESRRRTQAKVCALGGGVMVVSSARSAKVMQIITMKIAWWFNRGDDIYSMYMRFSLNVC
jgi:hypothetical protein